MHVSRHMTVKIICKIPPLSFHHLVCPYIALPLHDDVSGLAFAVDVYQYKMVHSRKYMPAPHATLYIYTAVVKIALCHFEPISFLSAVWQFSHSPAHET